MATTTKMGNLDLHTDTIIKHTVSKQHRKRHTGNSKTN